MKDKKKKVLIVGAGKGGSALINLFKDTGIVEIVGVVDIDMRAPGVLLAKNFDIPISKDATDFIGIKGLEEIFNVTGSETIHQQLESIKPRTVDLIGGHSAKFMWSLIGGYIKTAEEKVVARKYAEHILEVVPSGIFTVDPERNITTWNKEAEEITGYSASDVIGQKCSIFSDMPCKEKCGLFLCDIKKPIINSECTIVRKNGDMRIVSKNSDLLKNIKGEVVGGIECFEDITDRRKTEDGLKESESSFRALFDNVNDGMLVIDDKGKRFTDCNHKLQEMTGYSRDEFLKMGIKDLYPKKDLPFVLEQFENQKKGILQTAIDIPVKRKDGSIFYADVTASFMHAFGKDAVVGTFRDMTERREVDRQLSIFKTLADASGQGFGMAELDGTITYVNGKLATMLGEDSSDKAIGNKLFPYYPEKYRGLIKNEILPTIMKEGQWIGELQLLGKDGTVIPTIENFFLIKNDEGNPMYIADIMTDITERKKMEEDLRASEMSYRTIFANTGTVTAILEEDMTVQMVNSEFAKFFGYSKEEIEGKMNILEFVCKEEEEKVKNYHRLRRIDPEAAPRNYELRATHKNKSVSDTFITVAVIPETNRSVVSILDVTELKRNEFELHRQKDLLSNTNKALEHKLTELQEAIGHIKKLEGLVPICSNCKKMMMEGHNPKNKDAWVSLEKFISDRTNASFTHGLCPGCIKKMYGDMYRITFIVLNKIK